MAFDDWERLIKNGDATVEVGGESAPQNVGDEHPKGRSREFVGFDHEDDDEEPHDHEPNKSWPEPVEDKEERSPDEVKEKLDSVGGEGGFRLGFGDFVFGFVIFFPN